MATDMLNGLAVVFLGGLLLESGLSLAAQTAELRSLREPLPSDFADFYDSGRYRRSQDYARARARVNLAAFAFDLALLLVFWLAGGFGWWDGVVRGTGWGPVGTGLLFVGGLALGRSLLSLPFGIYATFVVEARFGFNRTTPATYAADLAKGLILALVIGAPLLAAVLWLLAHPGWLPYALLWAGAVLLSILFQYVIPTWIMPLFNKFTPLESGEVREAVAEYAQTVSFPIRSLYVVDGSRRSTKANAFFTGFGRHKRLALFDTLLVGHDTEEVVAVVAHEVGHYKLHHVVWGMIAGFVELAVGVTALSLLMNSPQLYAAFGVPQASVYAGVLLAGVFMSPFAGLASVPMLSLSRRHEHQADAYAARTSGGPGALVRALKKLAADSLSHLTPAPLYVLLNYSHPPTVTRVRALLGGKGGEPPQR
jgi:STE24 endopeptidase